MLCFKAKSKLVSFILSFLQVFNLAYCFGIVLIIPFFNLNYSAFHFINQFVLAILFPIWNYCFFFVNSNCFIIFYHGFIASHLIIKAHFNNLFYTFFYQFLLLFGLNFQFLFLFQYWFASFQLCARQAIDIIL